MARVQYFGKTTASTSVTVYWAGTTTKPTIYGSATGSSISNPLTSSFEGDYSFWVDEGHYKILNGKLVNGVATNIDDAYILSTQGAEPTASKSSLAPFQTNTATDVEEWVEGAYTGATYVAASALKSATTVVGVAAATAPSSGQVLTATSSTTATWQTPASGTPPGADTQVIFNDGGAYGADADLTYNKTTNTLTTTTFVGALTGNASTATTATNATNTGITDDTTTNATMYITWVTATTGNLPQKVSSTKCTFNPSTGRLTATQYQGPTDANVFGLNTTYFPSCSWTDSGIMGLGGGGGTGTCNMLCEFAAQNVLVLNSGAGLWWSSSGVGSANPSTLRTNKDAAITRAGAANIQLGAAAANPPVAQTLSVQDASGTDIAGATWTFRASRGTGTGTPGSIAFQTSTALGTGTTLQTATTRLTISSTAVTSTLPVIVPGYTVANLPTGVTGMRAYVTDANATTFLSTVAGGGANVVPVFYDGTNWVIG